jgi:hypothetical protein
LGTYQRIIQASLEEVDEDEGEKTVKAYFGFD